MDLNPKEILAVSIEKSEEKGHASFGKLTILGFLAGAFIAFAAEGSNMAAFNLLMDPNSYGLGRALAGALFGTGLMLVIIAGGELFTGNTMMINGVLAKKIKTSEMLRNWLIVYLANFVGSLFIAVLLYYSGLFSAGGDLLGAATVKIAVGKVNLSFIQAFFLGILCNWLVCLAVWMAWGAKSIVGKIFAIFFPIWLFITSGFEHSVANMYYIPAGILASANETFVALSGVSAEALAELTWGGFLVNNLLPVTLGNIIGGGVFVGMAYYLAFKEKKK